MSDEERMQCHCCGCVLGVLFTLLGISLLSTGVSMVLDYGTFDKSTLPSGWQNSDGQRNLGIILTCVSIVMLTGSIVVSVLFFTNNRKCRSQPRDNESATGEGNTAAKEIIPKPVGGIVTVSQPSETTPRPAHRRSKNGNRRRKKSRKPAPIQLETHHESVEEHDPASGGRDTRSASKRTLSFLLREKQKVEPSVDINPNQDITESQTDVAKSVSHLPPLLIAPADEQFSTCDVDNDSSTKSNEPEVFRVKRGSLSSEDSSSIIASTSTGDTFRPWPSPRDTVPHEQFDRELSDILK